MTVADVLVSNWQNTVARYGRSAVLSSIAVGAYDPTTSSAAQTITTVNITVITTSYKDNLVDGTLITANDRKAIISTRGLGATVPKAVDQITIDGDLYTIIKVDEYKLGGNLIGYIAQVRR